jgi:hypothetical protein
VWFEVFGVDPTGIALRTGDYDGFGFPSRSRFSLFSTTQDLAAVLLSKHGETFLRFRRVDAETRITAD